MGAAYSNNPIDLFFSPSFSTPTIGTIVDMCDEKSIEEEQTNLSRQHIRGVGARLDLSWGYEFTDWAATINSTLLS